MYIEPHIPVFDMILCLSEAMDLVSPSLVNHHKQVAYLASSIAQEMHLSFEECDDILLAGAMHDSGALTKRERIAALQFEIDNPYKHAEIGYRFLKSFKPFEKIALLVRYHHHPWNGGKSEVDMPFGSRILNLADRFCVLLDGEQNIISRVRDALGEIERHSGTLFMPEAVKALKALTQKEYIWFDLFSPSLTGILSRKIQRRDMQLEMDGLEGVADLFRRIIDFRSPFTADHSLGVTSVASALAEKVGFSEGECRMMNVAGQLHDLGKLAVAAEILEKPGKLTADERNIIKCHTYYTYQVMAGIRGLEVINLWASLHHERLDGTGYPFHYNYSRIPLGSRIMAAADVFTAISEDRPYRKGMEKKQVISVLMEMAREGALDTQLAALLAEDFDSLNELRLKAQKLSASEYKLIEGLGKEA